MLTPDQKTMNGLNDAVECCDTPELSVSDYRWGRKQGVWHFDAICHNCWEMSGGDIKAIEVEITR